MQARVVKIVTELIIELDQRWIFRNMQGNRVKLAGLLPGGKDEQHTNKLALDRLLMGHTVTLLDFLCVNGDTLYALVKYNDKYIHEYFPERAVVAPSPSTLLDVNESRIMTRVYSGVPVFSHNPIPHLSSTQSPLLGNVVYPVKPWEKDYSILKQIADHLYVDDHYNKVELAKVFSSFIDDTRRHAPLLIVGEVGIGKSWYLCHTLMNLPKDKYHVVIIDLRYTKRGLELEQSIDFELHEFLNYYIRDLTWLHPDFEAICQEGFDPHDPGIISQMRAYALNMPIAERNHRRMHYYGKPGAPDLIVAFDNIDHYQPHEQEHVVDICRRIVGQNAGVKLILAIRPTATTVKSRVDLFFGDGIPRTVHLRSPNIYTLLQRRLTINSSGDTWSLDTPIPGTTTTWKDFLIAYQKSDSSDGLARFVKEVCSTATMGPRFFGDDSTEEIPRQTDILTKYDCRHYVKLFRRIVSSSCISSLKKIGSIYHGIQALMLHGVEPLDDAESYLFNLFDNNSPLLPGNALVRYRVLEYFQTYEDAGEPFDVYFRAIGCGADVARKVIDTFERAGLLELEYVFGADGRKVPVRGRLTVPGQRHLEVCQNLWYLICVKTGMYIFDDFILRGNDAMAAAMEVIPSKRVVSFYAKYGWVSEEKFLDFLGIQEHLEAIRIGHFQDSHPEWSQQVANMMANMTRPSTVILYSYKEQLEAWKKSRVTRPHIMDDSEL